MAKQIDIEKMVNETSENEIMIAFASYAKHIKASDAKIGKAYENLNELKVMRISLGLAIVSAFATTFMN